MASPDDDQLNDASWQRRALDLGNKYFGETLQNIGDIAADRIALWKLRNRLSVMRKAETLITEANFSDPRVIATRLGWPLVQALDSEDDETLQNIWARLLKNAVDPNKSALLVSRHLIDVVRALEPVDVIVLEALFSEDLTTPVQRRKTLDWMASPFPFIGMDDLLAILDRLAALGLLRAETEGGVGFAAHEDYLVPAQFTLFTPGGSYGTQHLLLVLKKALASD